MEINGGDWGASETTPGQNELEPGVRSRVIEIANLCTGGREKERKEGRTLQDAGKVREVDKVTLFSGKKTKRRNKRPRHGK